MASLQKSTMKLINVYHRIIIASSSGTLDSSASNGKKIRNIIFYFILYKCTFIDMHFHYKANDMFVSAGPGLAFIAYPEAVAQMPLAPLWSAIFFLMIILLGLDSQFVGVEGFVTFIVDLNPGIWRRGRFRREILIGLICIASFLVGLSMVCRGGMYVFQLFDYYSVSRTIFVIAFIEMIVVSYIYGIGRFHENLEAMYRTRVTPFVKVCWAIITPTFILTLFVAGVISYSNLTYDRKSVSYEYPQWAIMIGWVLASASIVWIPIVAAYRLYQVPGTLSQRVREAIKPKLKKHQIRPNEDLSKIKYIGEDEE
ncbi:S6A13-like protein [Mya arenaria]|uniref:S6A13-like protein n=1 Tax=Mya arenaria TaxID=6604 RepID=A0ABY7DVE8_MYAAR|nr:S6A13-like protein [Mya arenaria]